MNAIGQAFFIEFCLAFCTLIRQLVQQDARMRLIYLASNRRLLFDSRILILCLGILLDAQVSSLVRRDNLQIAMAYLRPFIDTFYWLLASDLCFLFISLDLQRPNFGFQNYSKPSIRLRKQHVRSSNLCEEKHLQSPNNLNKSSSN